MSTQPTAGAMRAANLIVPDIGNPMAPVGDARLRAAQIIDRETGAAELVAAIKNLLTARPEDWQQAATWAYAALAKAEGCK